MLNPSMEGSRGCACPFFFFFPGPEVLGAGAAGCGCGAAAGLLLVFCAESLEANERTGGAFAPVSKNNSNQSLRAEKLLLQVVPFGVFRALLLLVLGLGCCAPRPPTGAAVETREGNASSAREFAAPRVPLPESLAARFCGCGGDAASARDLLLLLSLWSSSSSSSQNPFSSS